MVDEAWRSYLGKVAREHSCRIEEIGARLGVWQKGRWLATCRVNLTVDHAQHAARTLNLTIEQVMLMYPSRWDGLALQVGALTHTRPNLWPNLPTAWTYTATPRACPTCRTENPSYTSLLWHLPWITHCARHGAALIDHSTADPPIKDSGRDRTNDLIGLLDRHQVAPFAGAEVPAPLALRAWLECAALLAATNNHRHWSRPPTIHEADHWLNQAAPIAQANRYDDAEKLVRTAVRSPTLGESHYRQARLYSPPLRDLIDSALSRWAFPLGTVQVMPARIPPFSRSDRAAAQL